MKYPTYIVKFSEDNTLAKYGHCAIVYKSVGGRDYVGEYLMKEVNGALEPLVNPRNWKRNQSVSWGHTSYFDDLSKPKRFNVIIGRDGYPVTDCYFFSKDAFVEEFFADLIF